jgi:hypothetical protein
MKKPLILVTAAILALGFFALDLNQYLTLFYWVSQLGMLAGTRGVCERRHRSWASSNRSRAFSAPG